MIKKTDNYQEKLKREQDWYKPKKRKRLSNKILYHPIFYSYDRVVRNYIFPKQQLSKVVDQLMLGKKGMILNAPCGRGDDLKYFEQNSTFTVGIDISNIALETSKCYMAVLQGDLSSIPLKDESFDLVVSPLFLHHMVHFGFQPFLTEFHRILKPGGKFITLEPSFLYPINLITRPIKRLFQNPFGEVEDEGPFLPGLMVKELKRAGFINIGLRAASFSHPAFYIPISQTINKITQILLNLKPFSYFGWLLLYWGRKRN